VLALFVIGSCLPPSAGARTWIVDQGGAGDFTAIQPAIDAASDGDVIQIGPGTYFERLRLVGKFLDLIGEQGREQTIVDAEGSGSALRVDFTPGGIPLVRGISFTNGSGTFLRSPAADGRYGGGALVESSAPRFEDCAFTGNVANFGGGAFVLGGVGDFIRCRFDGNSAGNGAGFGAMHDGGSRLDDCDIHGNSGVFGGGIDLFRSRLVLSGCRIRGNVAYEGGAIRVIDRENVPVRIEDCLLAENAADRGGAIYAWQSYVTVDQSTIARNFAAPDGGNVQAVEADLSLTAVIVESQEPAPLVACSDGAPELRCVVLWGPIAGDPACLDGEGVLMSDPLFCEPEIGDYTLRSDSPCLPGEGGPPGCDRIGAYEAGCSPPVPVREEGWGRVKQLYR
jgi:hypothetical protein